jgi:hypothetical protein
MSKLAVRQISQLKTIRKIKRMKPFFDVSKVPTQNAIVLAYFEGLLGAHVGKYQDGRLVLLHGQTSHDWSDVLKWRYSDVKDSSVLVVEDKPERLLR